MFPVSHQDEGKNYCFSMSIGAKHVDLDQSHLTLPERMKNVDRVLGKLFQQEDRTYIKYGTTLELNDENIQTLPFGQTRSERLW